MSSYATLLAAISAVILVSGCGDKDPHQINRAGKEETSRSGGAKASSSPAAPSPADPMDATLRPGMDSYVKLGRVERTNVAPTLDALGRIEVDARLVARIGAAVSGRVTEIHAEVGQTVQRGQTLAEIASPELTTAQLNYLRAYSNSQLSERAVDRARQLLQADVIGSAELQRRESELAIARAELGAAGDQLKLMGISAEQTAALSRSGALSPRLMIPSTISGVVIERKLSQGQVSQPGDSLFTVADLSRVWVVGALPEQAARYVKVGQAVEMEVSALRGRKLSGRVVQVGDTVSPDTRTVEFRTEVANTDRELKPMMMVSMRVMGEPQQRLVVPSSAVVRESDADHVFIRTASNRFRLVRVELGPASDGLRPLVRGLQEGSEIIIDGAFHLNNERKRAELE